MITFLLVEFFQSFNVKLHSSFCFHQGTPERRLRGLRDRPLPTRFDDAGVRWSKEEGPFSQIAYFMMT